MRAQLHSLFASDVRLVSSTSPSSSTQQPLHEPPVLELAAQEPSVLELAEAGMAGTADDDTEVCYICLEPGGELLAGICLCKSRVHAACQLRAMVTAAATPGCEERCTHCTVCKAPFSNAELVPTRRKLTQRGKFGVAVTSLLLVGTITALLIVLDVSSAFVVGVAQLVEFGVFWLAWLLVLRCLGRKAWFQRGMQVRVSGQSSARLSK